MMTAFKDPEVMAALQDGTSFCLCWMHATLFGNVVCRLLLVNGSFFCYFQIRDLINELCLIKILNITLLFGYRFSCLLQVSFVKSFIRVKKRNKVIFFKTNTVAEKNSKITCLPPANHHTFCVFWLTLTNRVLKYRCFPPDMVYNVEPVTLLVSKNC